ncbi:AraC family transcriptional regulator [Actinoplanes sp. Pm04-4]|uniref:AraC family transcriptional regulator n=1 Tax=Paractinoplanes pyxinae TaxID=2997416 RepID=A0ABT4BGU9_9ACTN|nr:AraC family transcriptional regulator [Actinoplanes pyxinae]MCY1145758.1 AraC family transcriptional regulator [Actinoplanes pyxinae]
MDFWIRSAHYGSFRADLVRAEGLRYTAAADPIQHIVGGVVVKGRGMQRTSSREYSVVAGDAYLCPLDVPFDGEHEDAEFAVVSLPLSVAGMMAEAASGSPADRFTFHDMAPVSPAMGRHWSSTLSFVHRQLATPDLVLPTLLVDHLVELVASATVATFPNTAMTVAHPSSDGYVSPATVRRAVDFIEAHADQSLTVADVAAAASVGPRAIQAAFRRTFDMTPMGYVRQVRLAHAHNELSVADPSGDVTVTDIARGWGFSNVGRFTSLYRAEYGQSPRRTLRT